MEREKNSLNGTTITMDQSTPVSQDVEKQNETSSLDKSQLEQLSPEQLSPEQQEQLVALKAFLINNKHRVEQWAKAHEKHHLKHNYPIYWDSNRKEFLWMNRKQRRNQTRK